MAVSAISRFFRYLFAHLGHRHMSDHPETRSHNAALARIAPAFIQAVRAASISGVYHLGVVGGGYDGRMNEQRIHRIFEVSVLLKGAHAVVECIGGLALAFVSTTSIVGWVNSSRRTS